MIHQTQTKDTNKMETLVDVSELSIKDSLFPPIDAELDRLAASPDPDKLKFVIYNTFSTIKNALDQFTLSSLYCDKCYLIDCALLNVVYGKIQVIYWMLMDRKWKMVRKPWLVLHSSCWID